MQQTLARSNLYALLSRLLMQELDEALLDVLQSDDAILEMMPNFKAWELRSEQSGSALIERHLNPDFVNLTLLHLIPYETFFTRDDQMIETGGANPVTDIYSTYGFMVDFEAARVVSPDHIGVELEFMHHLCEALSRAESGNDREAVADLLEVQRDFLEKHLVRWAPLFLLNMKYEARTPLYFDAADMALEFLLSDFEFLSAA